MTKPKIKDETTGGAAGETAPAEPTTASAPAAPMSTVFDTGDGVNPPEATATMEAPPARIEKRGRKPGAKKKPTEASADIHLANAEMITSALDLLRAGISGGECQPSPEMRGECVKAWDVYLKTQGVNLPPWVQVAVVSVMYTAPAFATPRGKGIVSGAWAKVKAWYIARRG